MEIPSFMNEESFIEKAKMVVNIKYVDNNLKLRHTHIVDNNPSVAKFLDSHRPKCMGIIYK